MRAKYKIMSVEEVSHLFFKLGYQFDRTLTFIFDTRKSATNFQLDDVVDWWAIQMIQVEDMAIIIAMDGNGNNLRYKKIPWASQCVAEFLDDYCKEMNQTYKGLIRINFKAWLETEDEYEE